MEKFFYWKNWLATVSLVFSQAFLAPLNSQAQSSPSSNSKNQNVVGSGLSAVDKERAIRSACKSAGTGVYQGEDGVLYKTCRDYMSIKIDKQETARVESFNKMQEDKHQIIENMRKTNLNNKVESIKAASDSQYKMARTKMVIAAALTAAFGCVAAMVCTTAAGAGCISDSKLLIACNKTAMAIEMAVGNAVMSCQTACMVYGAGAAIAGMATISAYKSMQQSVVSADQLSTLGSLATPTGQLPKMIKSSEIIDPKNPMGALLDDPEVPAQTKNNIANFNASLAKINNQGIGIDFMNGNFSSNGKNYNANQISQSKEFNNSIGQAMNELHQPSQQTANRILNEPANRGGTNNRNTATTSTADDFRLSNPTNSNNTGRSAGYGSVNKINRAPSSFTGTEYFPAEPTQTIQYKNGETIHAAETRPAANGAPSLFVVGKPVMPIIERTSGFLAQ